MKLEEKWGKLAKRMGGRIVSYYGDSYLEVTRGLIETDHGDIPEFIRRYHLHLPESFSHKKIYFLDMENCGFNYSSPINTITIGGINGDIISKTFFALDYHGERPILRKCLNTLKTADIVFTYNGSAFDTERLSRRMETYGMFSENGPSSLKDILGNRHCDLYPIFEEFARRNDKALLDKKLQTLEKVLFGTHREHEIEGRDIPIIYENFIFGPNGEGNESEIIEQMGRVIDHNIRDVFSLGAALEYLRREGYVPKQISNLVSGLVEENPRTGSDVTYIQPQ